MREGWGNIGEGGRGFQQSYSIHLSPLFPHKDSPPDS